jgi:uncharacterized RDD family membrane protein YckC
MSGGPNQPPGYPPGNDPQYPQQDPQQNPYPQQGQYPQQNPYPQQGAYPQQPHQPYGHGASDQDGYYTTGFVPPAHLPVHGFGGFWIRVVAYLIDFAILLVPSMIISFVVMSAFGFGMGTMFNPQSSGTLEADMVRLQIASNLSNLISILMFAAYTVFFLVKFGGTPGKLAVGLRVVGEDGNYLGIGRATGRYFAELLSWCLCFGGYIMVAFHQQKRGLHDLIVSSYVVRKELVNPGQHHGL